MSDISADQTTLPAADDERISEEEFRSKSPRVQLRLHHFFALTAVMAVLLTISKPQTDFGNPAMQMPESIQTVQAVFYALYQIPAAVALTALGYGIAAYRRGELFFNQPGDWLLVEVSLITLLGIPLAIIFRWVQFDTTTGPGGPALAWMIFFGIYSLLALFLGKILINIYLSRKCHQPRWKRVFYGKAASTVLSFLGEILVLVFLVMAMRADREDRLLRSASHRCGVYVQLAQSLMMLAGAALGIIGMVVFFLMR